MVQIAVVTQETEDPTYQQHLDRQQVNENETLVPLAGAMAVLEGEGQVLFRCQDTKMQPENPSSADGKGLLSF